MNNPSSIHAEGLMAEKKVEEARAKIAEILFAHPDEIIFTGSGTESDNLAILGVAEAIGVRNATSSEPEVVFRTPRPGHIITTAIEHKAVLEPCRHLQKKGYRVTYLGVDKNGQVNLKELKESLTKDTFLVSVMMANNEIGTIQPIKEIAKNLEAAVQGINRLVNSNDLQRSIYELQDTLQETKQTMRSLRLLTEYLEQHPEAILKGKPVIKGE